MDERIRGAQISVSDGQTQRKETKYCVCEKCGKEWHYDNAKFCGICGEKLKEVPAKNSL